MITTMKITISSDSLTAEFDTLGAELCSLKDASGVEYIWQADKNIWARHSPVLFPFICSVKDKKYTADGKEYEMPWNHGFARDMEFDIICRGDSFVVFSLSSNEHTLSVYPYEFTFSVSYKIIGNKLEVTYTAENNSETNMYCYVGGHPAFNCPLEEGEDFSDYSVVYGEAEDIVQEIPDGDGERVILENESVLALTHELFKYDVIMKDAPKSSFITLKSNKSARSVRLEFPDADCIAVWSPARDDANFVCLEPWSSVPSFFDDAFPAIEEKPHAICVQPEEEYAFFYNIIIE